VSDLIVIVSKSQKFMIEVSENVKPGTILVVPPRRRNETDDELVARSIIISNLQVPE